ncbi:MAG: Crp/Fnr family transcriptional regulator [Armatimonadetes bacterium]|nr:Crp/Fnr family transcriptional regulator [Armatimonadota bacterium]
MLRRRDPMKVTLSDLRKITVLGVLSDRRLRKFLPYCRKRMLPKNTVVFLADEPAAHLYFVLDGAAAMVVTGGGEVRATVHTAQAGQCFGWSSLVPPYMFSATAQCIEPTLVVEVDAEGLRRLFAKDYKVGFAMMSIVACLATQRLHETHQTLIETLGNRRALESREPVLAG